MKPEDEEKITRWMDGELTDADVEDLLAAHPELNREKTAAQEMGDLLRRELEDGEDIPFPDFFNRQIQRHIEEEQELEERKKAYEGMPEESFFSWFTFSRNIAAAALLVLLGVFIGKAFFDSRTGASQIVNTYTPDPAVTATMYDSKPANATVLVLEGLSAIPSETPITGHQTASYMPDSGGLVPTLYSVNGTGPALVLVKDEQEIPTIYEVDLPVGGGKQSF